MEQQSSATRSPTREEQQQANSVPINQNQRPPVNSQAMPQPHMVHPFRPLLPAGWTEHRAPNGMFYYYNASTGQSTWERPIMLAPPPPMGVSPMGVPQLVHGVHPSPFQSHSSMMSMPMLHPSTMKQQTTMQGTSPQQAHSPKKEKRKEKKKKEKAKGKNVFIPRQIGETSWYIVKTTEGNEFYYNSDTKQSVWEVPEEVADEVKKIKEQELIEQSKVSENGGSKRKINETEEDNAGEDPSLKKARGTEEGHEGTELTADDIAYQLQFMEEEELDGTEEAENNHDINTRIEGENFNSLLKDMNVSPFAVWEKELPRIIHDPRYTIISTLKQRKEIFDEYCKEKVVEMRAEKKKKAKTRSAQEEFEKLLEDEVSLGTHWDDFRRKFKRDPRFKGYDNEKDKEKKFREHVKYLKDKEAKKRKAQQKRAEKEFIELLQETREIQYDSSWRKVKRIIDEDHRYEALESEDRERLFREYCRKLEAEDEEEMAKREEERKQKERKTREEASLRKREAEVRRELSFHNRSKDLVKKTALHDEAVLEFQGLLIDMIRSHQVTWEEKRPELERDPRFHNESLALADKISLFEDHLTDIYQKRLKAYHELLDQHVKLDTTWVELQSIVKDDPRAVRLSKQESVLEPLFEKYLESRIQKATAEFKQLLHENQFVEYRARMVKLSEDGATDETGAGKEKAPGLTIEEIHDVLKDDQRYLILNPMPELRETIIKEYLENIETPSLTVHQGRD
ncbi:11474_t:CDS:10 [Ambispora leptoticha]|uniref:11474_t:CDS:1 n=1 Tax=Ambispora leptoticha TaxID=144679 RepID=A0A9N8VH29_9GLOM|nr:11474_t:CDS:10 [Ambispora leptoticha]